MKVTITVKEVNPEFDATLPEGELNVKYNWEDEFDVTGEVKDFSIRNNETFRLEGLRGEEKFSYEIPSMTIVECAGENGVVSRFAASRKLIKDTKKNVDKKNNVHFFMFLKGGHPHVNPMPGVYISAKDFPAELPPPAEEEITGDEEE